MANVIELQNINKSFGNHQIFRNLSLEIEKGDFVCITGPSGKGKSTLLNIIGMLDTPDAGTVRISGVENPKLSSRVGRKLLKNELFYVFQNYGLVEDKTVR